MKLGWHGQRYSFARVCVHGPRASEYACPCHAIHKGTKDDFSNHRGFDAARGGCGGCAAYGGDRGGVFCAPKGLEFLLSGTFQDDEGVVVVVWPRRGGGVDAGWRERIHVDRSAGG